MSHRVIKLFCWMTPVELVACCARARVDLPAAFNETQRKKALKALERKGWWRADVTDVGNPKLQRVREEG